MRTKREYARIIYEREREIDRGRIVEKFSGGMQRENRAEVAG